VHLVRICNISTVVNDSLYWHALHVHRRRVSSSKTQCLLVQYKLNVLLHTSLLQSLLSYSYWTVEWSMHFITVCIWLVELSHNSCYVNNIHDHVIECSSFKLIIKVILVFLRPWLYACLHACVCVCVCVYECVHKLTYYSNVDYSTDHIEARKLTTHSFTIVHTRITKVSIGYCQCTIPYIYCHNIRHSITDHGTIHKPHYGWCRKAFSNTRQGECSINYNLLTIHWISDKAWANCWRIIDLI